MLTRGRAIGLVAIVGLLVLGTVAVLQSATPSCGYATPYPSLPPALSSQGGFDQSFDPADARLLEETSVHAATALYPDLIGSVASAPVAVRSIRANRPDANVVALRSTSAAESGRVAAFVIFLSDCSGRFHFSTVDDLHSGGPPAFPPVDRATAAARLGSSIELVYSQDPQHPYWRVAGGVATFSSG